MAPIGVAMPGRRLWIAQRGRGLWTRTVETPVYGRVFVVCALVQASVLVATDTVLALRSGDCITVAATSLLTVSAIFIVYFAVEAIRTENVYQLAAATVISTVVLLVYGIEFGMGHRPADAVTMGTYSAACALQLCAPPGP